MDENIHDSSVFSNTVMFYCCHLFLLSLDQTVQSLGSLRMNITGKMRSQRFRVKTLTDALLTCFAIASCTQSVLQTSLPKGGSVLLSLPCGAPRITSLRRICTVPFAEVLRFTGMTYAVFASMHRIAAVAWCPSGVFGSHMISFVLTASHGVPGTGSGSKTPPAISLVPCFLRILCLTLRTLLYPRPFSVTGKVCGRLSWSCLYLGGLLVLVE